MHWLNRVLAASIVTFASGLATPSRGNTELHLTFNGASILASQRSKLFEPAQAIFFGMRSAEGRRYEFTVDPGTDYHVWLNKKASSHLAPDEALGFRITAKSNENVKDKILLNVFRHRDPEAINLNSFESPKYISFRFKLDDKYEVPNQWALHLQLWQCCGGPPPFSIRVTPRPDRHGPVEFTFNVTEIARGAGPRGRQNVIHRMIVDRSRWYSMMLKLDPQPPGASRPGNIAVWLDNDLSFSYDGYWGYAPGSSMQSEEIGSVLGPNIGLGLGVYRRRQKTTQIIYFDDIKVGRTYEAIRP
jgi:hypothetical protein